MNAGDAELVRILEARDGPLGTSWRPHRTEAGECRFEGLYPDGDCPWCEAEVKRVASGTGPSPQRKA